MGEIGVYLPQGREAKAWASSILRYLPLRDVMVYTLNGGPENAPLDFHGIPWVAVNCERPGCGGISPQRFAAFIEKRKPDKLIMFEHPYGMMLNEMVDVVTERQSSSNYFVARLNMQVEQMSYRAGAKDFSDDFCYVFKTEGGLLYGMDVVRTVPFEPFELPDRRAARNHLGAGDRPFVMILSSAVGAIPKFGQFAIAECKRRGVDYVVWDQYPAMPYYLGADLVVTAADFAVNELQAVDVAYQAVADVRFPNQVVRANATPASLTAAIAGLEVGSLKRFADFENDAENVAELIR